MSLDTSTPFAVTVVIPCLNEQDNVSAIYEETIAELGRYDGLEILFVDDGSTDLTLERIRRLAQRDPAVSYLSFTRNFGLEAAFSAGYQHARYPWVLHLDADLQFPPAEAHRLIARAGDGFDAVFGVRVDRKDRWVRRAGSALHEFIARRLLGIEIPSGGTSFRLVRTDLARRIIDLRLGTPYFLATLPRLTRSWTTVTTAHRQRASGEAKVSVRGLARHAIELFFSYSGKLMTYAVLLSAGCAAIAGGAAVAIMVGAPGAVASVALAVALSGGLVALATVGRYLVHIGRGQPGLPLYLVREANIKVRDECFLGEVLHPAVRSAA